MASRSSQSEVMPISCRKKTLFLGVFLDKISFPGQTVDFRLQHVTLIWKAYASAVNLSYLETILMHPTRRQSFAGKLHRHLRNIWASSYIISVPRLAGKRMRSLKISPWRKICRLQAMPIARLPIANPERRQTEGTTHNSMIMHTV